MAKTVITSFVDGNPRGTQYSTISNKLCQMFVIPRSNLSYLNEKIELHRPAFYILLGEDDKAYIGETENFCERVKDHNKKKDFWQKALIFVSKDENMTKSDVKYLEYRGIEEAKKANMFILEENKQIPKAPNLPEYQKSAMEDFFEDIKFLTSFIGYRIFEDLHYSGEHLFMIKSKRCNAKGFYCSSGFIVMAESTIVNDCVSSFTWKDRREEMLKDKGDFDKEKGIYTLKSNLSFPSPSAAAMFCLGRPANGWMEWVDDKGKTLDAVYREQLE